MTVVAALIVIPVKCLLKKKCGSELDKADPQKEREESVTNRMPNNHATDHHLQKT